MIRKFKRKGGTPNKIPLWRSCQKYVLDPAEKKEGPLIILRSLVGRDTYNCLPKLKASLAPADRVKPCPPISPVGDGADVSC